MLLFLLLVVVPGVVLAGSQCPPRPDIYPCSCANVPLGKRQQATVVTCRGMPDPASLEAVLPGLRALEIDQLHMLDAFLGARDGERSLPGDWLSLLKVRDMEIADSDLDQCFMCPARGNCRNSAITRLSISNSSSSDKLCGSCGSPKQPWTSCLSELRELHFTRGRLTSLTADLFPAAMRELVSLNLSRNQIVKVDPGVLRNLPKLKSLDLSRNAIEYIDHLFKGQVINLEYLDISWNFIKSLGADMFVSLPKLKLFKADNNLLTDMKQGEWKNAPTSLKNIDLSDNPMHCDCNLRWVNGTFSVNTLVLGTCATPQEYSRSPLRRASRFLKQRCSPSGVLGTRAPTSRPRRRHA